MGPCRTARSNNSYYRARVSRSASCFPHPAHSRSTTNATTSARPRHGNAENDKIILALSSNTHSETVTNQGFQNSLPNPPAPKCRSVVLVCCEPNPCKLHDARKSVREYIVIESVKFTVSGQHRHKHGLKPGSTCPPGFNVMAWTLGAGLEPTSHGPNTFSPWSKPAPTFLHSHNMGSIYCPQHDATGSNSGPFGCPKKTSTATGISHVFMLRSTSKSSPLRIRLPPGVLCGSSFPTSPLTYTP